MACLLAAALAGGVTDVSAQGTSTVHLIGADKVPAALAVRATLTKPPKGTQELKFQEMFQMPVGPKGIQASERLLSLDGQRVRMVGFMVRSSGPRSTAFILAPMPVEISDEDEAEADDIPFNAVLVKLSTPATQSIPNLDGLLKVSGVLHVANVEDPDSSRIFPVTIDLDPGPTNALAKTGRQVTHGEEIARKRSR